MEHEMRAEYEEGVLPHADTPVKIWHMVRLDGTLAMCGRELAPAAATQTADVWGTPRESPSATAAARCTCASTPGTSARANVSHGGQAPYGSGANRSTPWPSGSCTTA